MTGELFLLMVIAALFLLCWLAFKIIGDDVVPAFAVPIVLTLLLALWCIGNVLLRVPSVFPPLPTTQVQEAEK